MPTNNQPPPKPPANSGQPRTPQDDALKPGLDERVESLKSVVVSILKGTEWPPDSTDAAESLINTINSGPDISTNKPHTTKELQNLVEKYIEILDDIHTRLKDASSKAAMKRWKFLQMIKSVASNRPSKCALLFQTCQDDLLRAMNALSVGFWMLVFTLWFLIYLLKKSLEYEQAKDDGVAGGLESLPEVQIHSSGQEGADSPAQDLATGTAEQGSTSDDATSNPLIPKTPLLNTPQKQKGRDTLSDEALSVARKTFKSVEIASGAIPVAGTYIGAAAKVGLAFVETLQTMDRNDSLAIDLADHTYKLNKLVERFKGRSNIGEKEMADQVDALQKELVLVNKKVEEWSSLGRFKKAFLARDHGETLKDYQGRIQTAREEIQLLVSVDSRNMIADLDRDRLLKCLGDGQFGARGTMIEDIICFPGTRLNVLERIENWIRDTSLSNRVMWICGMAGRGKSTIASTVVHHWRSRASCALFHFRRGQTAVNSRVLCALARQLGSSLVPEVTNAVLETVRQNEGIAEPGRRLDEQFETVFVAPLAKIKNHTHPIIVVIDALDECDNPKDAVNLVRLIHEHSPSFPTNVKFLLTCRPDDPIRRHLESKQWPKEDLDSAPDINNDLSRFIQHACAQIRDDHDLSEDWPSPGDIEQMVQMSQGLFQWARTVVTYISDGSPVDRLWALLKRPTAWSGLDDLYHQILSKAFDSVRLDPVRQDILRRVLGSLVVAPHPVSLEVIATLYREHEIFDETKNDRIIPFLRKDVLADLNSLLFIPESPAESMRLMHTSIQDLLSSELRCKQQPFYVDPTQCHQQLASECLRIMLVTLKENICDLSDFSKSSLDVQDIVERVISKGLVYCCRAWATHLTQGVKVSKQGENVTIAELAHFEAFSSGTILYWLEVMSLVGATAEAITSAKRMHQWLVQTSQIPGDDSLVALWDDVQRFITTFLEPISFGPLQIYTSALPHCPVETEIWSRYGKHSKVRILHGQRVSTWPSNLWVRSPSADVRTIAFSPDGRVLALGSDDSSVRLWDAQTGTALGDPLTGHSKSVWSVCFSPDGKVLASGSNDQTVRVWNIEARSEMAEPLIGHSGGVRSVCFLHNGEILASGSDDRTIRLWNTQTGAAIGEPLIGHSDWVLSVCLSPDGRILASGSADNTIRLWDPQTRLPIGEPFTGHIDRVWSVCFSPDGNLLASGSDDNTARLWNVPTRTLVRGPLTGHGGGVNSVCFSPDGNVLASGSDDRTIRLWRTQTGAPLCEPFAGHSERIWSVCYSSDGRLLASGSDDETVRLWDPQAGAAVAGSFISHCATVNCVCFSLDGKRLASGSDDKTIRLWDPRTGAAVGKPLTGHSDWVRSVCFSPDGNLLASASDDKTIRLWNPQTGATVGQPLIGHSDCIRSVCFSPNGEYLASGSSDATIRLWDPHTGVAMGEPLTGHSSTVRSVCFSPDSKRLASGSGDGTIRLWDPQARVPVGEPLEGFNARVVSVSFSPDGTLLMAGCEDGSVSTWDAIEGQRRDPSRSLSCNTNPHFQNHWIILHSSRLLWLPPQYWDTDYHGVALCDGLLAAFQMGPFPFLMFLRFSSSVAQLS